MLTKEINLKNINYLKKIKEIIKNFEECLKNQENKLQDIKENLFFKRNKEDYKIYFINPNNNKIGINFIKEDEVIFSVNHNITEKNAECRLQDITKDIKDSINYFLSPNYQQQKTAIKNIILKNIFNDKNIISSIIKHNKPIHIDIRKKIETFVRTENGFLFLGYTTIEEDLKEKLRTYQKTYYFEPKTMVETKFSFSETYQELINAKEEKQKINFLYEGYGSYHSLQKIINALSNIQ